MGKICTMEGVREYAGSDAVELWRNDENGQLVVRAYNEGGYSGVEIDLLDLVHWLQSGPLDHLVLDDGTRAIAIGSNLQRDRNGD